MIPLQFGGAFNQIANTLVRFFPRAIWSVFVLALGVGAAILVSSRARGAVEQSDMLADRVAGPFAYGVRLLLYFFAVTLALSELGLNTSVLVVFLDGVAFGLGVGVALAVGIAVGWGSKDYVAEHVEEWIRDVVADDGAAATADASGAAAEAAADGGSAAGGEGDNTGAAADAADAGGDGGEDADGSDEDGA